VVGSITQGWLSVVLTTGHKYVATNVTGQFVYRETSRTLQRFMKPENISPYWQTIATAVYPKAAELNRDSFFEMRCLCPSICAKIS